MDSDEDEEEPQNEPGTSSTLNLLIHYFLVIKDQQQVLKDQLSVTPLRMKTVSLVMKTVHRVKIPKGLSTIQVSTF